MPFYKLSYYEFICDTCGKIEILDVYTAKEARQHGWAISKDYRKCYCPNCADKIRSKGMRGKH